jgi:pyridinium-3,5-bisthiocarboxylic acid mononucleotide nickel chelatase
MTRHIHFDPLGGIAGDMTIAALVDAFPDLHEPMLAAIHGLGVPEGATLKVVPHRDHAVTGKRFLVDEPHHHHGVGHHGHAHALGTHTHGHVPFRDIRARLEASRLPEGARRRAVAIFTLLAEAESQVHGGAPEDVTFHELGGWDSIADIVGAAYLIDAIGAASWSVGSLPLGAGRVKTAHGILPVPAPAATLLMRGFQTTEDGIAGERVTPTGAAILKHLDCASRVGRTPRRLAGTGIGFGTKTFPGISNILRALVFEDAGAPAEWNVEDIAALSFEVDDQTPEDLAVGLDHLRGLPGVLDATQSPVLGKKGRIGAHIQVLCATAERDAVIAACFRETTTLGLRMATVQRATLPRVRAAGADGVPVKRARRPGGTVTGKAESDAVKERDGTAGREAARRRAEDSVADEPWDDKT